MASKTQLTQRSTTEIIPSLELPEFSQAISALADMEVQLEGLSRAARDSKIDSAQSFATAGELVAQLKSIDNSAAAMMKPYQLKVKAVSDFIRTKILRVSNKIVETRGVLNLKMGEWTERERRRTAAEQAKEREAKLAREQAAIKQDVQAGLFTKTEGKAALKQAEIEVQKLTVAPNIPSVAGVVKRTNYKAECTNQQAYIKAMCEAYKRNDHAQFDQMVLMVEVSNNRLCQEARETKSNAQMEKWFPFVRAWSEQTF